MGDSAGYCQPVPVVRSVTDAITYVFIILLLYIGQDAESVSLTDLKKHNRYNGLRKAFNAIL